MGGLGLRPTFMRGKRLILQHATAPVNLLAEAQQQAARAIHVRATRQVLHMEARGRGPVAFALHALQHILLDCIAQRKALILADASHCRMYGAAGRRDLGCLLFRLPPPVSSRTVPVIGVRSAHDGGPPCFPATPPGQTERLI